MIHPLPFSPLEQSMILDLFNPSVAFGSVIGVLAYMTANAAYSKWKEIQGGKRLDAAIKLIQSRGLEVQHRANQVWGICDYSDRGLRDAMSAAHHAGFLIVNKSDGGCASAT